MSTALVTWGTSGSSPGEWQEYTGPLVTGNARRKPLRYRYFDDATIEIALTQGKTALIDAEDFDKVKGYSWRAYAAKPMLWYARSNPTYLHQAVLDRRWIDHIDFDGLDCRKANMRPATPAQNVAHRRLRPGEGSRFRGVTMRKKSGSWMTKIKSAGVITRLTFASEEEAAAEYNRMARERFGEFAMLNDVPDLPPTTILKSGASADQLAKIRPPWTPERRAALVARNKCPISAETRAKLIAEQKRRVLARRNVTAYRELLTPVNAATASRARNAP